MSKKLLTVISVVLILTFVLAACTPKPDLSKEVTIKVWHQWDGKYLEAITQAFNDYTAAHPNVKFDLSKPEDVANALNVAIPAGEGPDIIGWANDQIGKQAIKGNIVPLDDYKIDAAYLKANFEASAVSAMSYKGKIWGLPESMEGVALVYNKKLVTDKYLPKDMNDFAGLLAAAEAFQKDNPGKTLICNQGFPGGDAYHIAPVFFGFGVPSYVDEAGKVTLNTPEGVKAMEWLVSVSKFLNKEQTYDLCGAGFKEGKVGMWWTGPWAIADIEKAKIEYGILQMGKPFVGIKTLMMSKNAVDRKNTDVAIDIIKYFTSADVQKKIVAANKTIPAPLAALNDPIELDAALKQLVDPLARPEWLIFTSANTVHFTLERFIALGYDLRALAGVKLAVIGKATGAALREWRLNPDFTAGTATAAGLAAELSAAYGLRHKHLLVPRSSAALPELPDLLMQAGARLPFRIVGFPDEYMVTGSQANIFSHYGISPDGLAATARALLSR